MTDHVIRFPIADDESIPVPQAGDKIIALFDDGVSEMYVVESEPLSDGGVRLRFEPMKPRLHPRPTPAVRRRRADTPAED